MIVAGPKLHPLWQTTLLPLLALVSCMSMGLGTVVVLTAMMKHSWNARHDQELLVEMCRVNGGLLVLFTGLRFADLLSAGKLELLAVPDFFLIVFVLETALFLIPAFVFLSGRVENARTRFVAALSAVAAGAIWRVDAFLTCYNGGESFSYWPSWGEIAVTVGMAAIGVAVFITITRLLPVVVVQTRPCRRPSPPSCSPSSRGRTREGPARWRPPSPTGRRGSRPPARRRPPRRRPASAPLLDVAGSCACCSGCPRLDHT